MRLLAYYERYCDTPALGGSINRHADSVTNAGVTRPSRCRNRIMMMIADSSQTRILRRLLGQSLHARWWLWSLFLDAHTLLRFGQTKVWAEDDWDAARSFWLRHLFFAALCLSASNLPLAFFIDERQLFRSKASCCRNGWLILECTSYLFDWPL